MNGSAANNRSTKVWDPLVKLTHWGVAALVVVNAVITEEGSGWHIWVGYALAALLVVRWLWGFIGPSEARFAAFPPSPRRALEHIAEIRKGEVTVHGSHNPLGALMVYALWLCLGTIVATGIIMAGAPPTNPNIDSKAREHVVEGQLGVDPSQVKERVDDGAEKAEAHEESLTMEIHEVAVNLLYALIALHLLGVIFETRRSGRSLVLAMLPGQSGKPS